MLQQEKLTKYRGSLPERNKEKNAKVRLLTRDVPFILLLLLIINNFYFNDKSFWIKK